MQSEKVALVCRGETGAWERKAEGKGGHRDRGCPDGQLPPYTPQDGTPDHPGEGLSLEGQVPVADPVGRLHFCPFRGLVVQPSPDFFRRLSDSSKASAKALAIHCFVFRSLGTSSCWVWCRPTTSASLPCRLSHSRYVVRIFFSQKVKVGRWRDSMVLKSSACSAKDQRSVPTTHTVTHDHTEPQF